MDLDRRTIFGLGVASAGLALASTAARAAPTAPVSVELRGGDAERFVPAIDDIRAYAELHMAVYGLPGLTLSVIGPDGLTARLRFGPTEAPAASAGHLFQVGSISKSFTALCIFRLVEAGKFTLDTDVRDLLPGVPLPAGKTSVQSLLNHSSGLPDDAPVFPRGGDGRLWRGFEPGTQWSYSNLGFLLLGMVAEHVAGRPYPTVLRQQVLEPLGMTETQPAILTEHRALYAPGHSGLYGDRPYPRAGVLGPGPWTDMTAGSGCVASTASDMGRYISYLIAAGRGKGAPLLSDAMAARFTRATIDAPGWAVPGSKYANGLAVVEVGGRMLLHHTGGMLSFNSAMHVDPQAGVGAFASTNVGLVPYRPRDITAFACARLREVVEGASAPRAAPAPAPPKPADTAAYAGRYAARNGEALLVEAIAGGLNVQIAGDQPFRMEPSNDDAFMPVEPQRTPFQLVFRRTDRSVVRAWFAGVEFVREQGGARVAAFSPPTPPELRALTGHYVSDDPWAGSFRVTAQGPALFIDDTAPLTRLPDGGYRAGDKDWSPERLWFDAPVDGRPTRAIASGVDHLRRPA
jgi:CubicO group peptidase (beta-lactamase class C family)